MIYLHIIQESINSSSIDVKEHDQVLSINLANYETFNWKVLQSQIKDFINVCRVESLYSFDPTVEISISEILKTQIPIKTEDEFNQLSFENYKEYHYLVVVIPIALITVTKDLIDFLNERLNYQKVPIEPVSQPIQLTKKRQESLLDYKELVPSLVVSVNPEIPIIDLPFPESACFFQKNPIIWLFNPYYLLVGNTNVASIPNIARYMATSHIRKLNYYSKDTYFHIENGWMFASLYVLLYNTTFDNTATLGCLPKYTCSETIRTNPLLIRHRKQMDEFILSTLESDKRDPSFDSTNCKCYENQDYYDKLENFCYLVDKKMYDSQKKLIYLLQRLSQVFDSLKSESETEQQQQQQHITKEGLLLSDNRIISMMQLSWGILNIEGKTLYGEELGTYLMGNKILLWEKEYEAQLHKVISDFYKNSQVLQNFKVGDLLNPTIWEDKEEKEEKDYNWVFDVGENLDKKETHYFQNPATYLNNCLINSINQETFTKIRNEFIKLREIINVLKQDYEYAKLIFTKENSEQLALSGKSHPERMDIYKRFQSAKTTGDILRLLTIFENFGQIITPNHFLLDPHQRLNNMMIRLPIKKQDPKLNNRVHASKTCRSLFAEQIYRMEKGGDYTAYQEMAIKVGRTTKREKEKFILADNQSNILCQKELLKHREPLFKLGRIVLQREVSKSYKDPRFLSLADLLDNNDLLTSDKLFISSETVSLDITHINIYHRLINYSKGMGPLLCRYNRYKMEIEKSLTPSIFTDKPLSYLLSKNKLDRYNPTMAVYVADNSTADIFGTDKLSSLFRIVWEKYMVIVNSMENLTKDEISSLKEDMVNKKTIFIHLMIIELLKQELNSNNWITEEFHRACRVIPKSTVWKVCEAYCTSYKTLECGDEGIIEHIVKV